MEILIPNNGKKVQYIVSSHVYVKVWDYGKMFLLSHFKIPRIKLTTSETVWGWISLSEGETTDLSDNSLTSFDDAINKAVNNPYCTVYEFESYEDMAKHWGDIKHIDTITTTFSAKKDD